MVFVTCNVDSMFITFSTLLTFGLTKVITYATKLLVFIANIFKLFTGGMGIYHILNMFIYVLSILSFTLTLSNNTFIMRSLMRTLLT